MIGNLGRYERTANLYDGQYEPQYYNDNSELTSDPFACHSTTYIPISSTRTFTISNTWYSAQYQAAFAVYEWDINKNWIRRSNRQNPTSTKTITFTVGNDCAYFTLQIQKDTPNIMLNKGATALPYVPYGLVWNDIPYSKLENATDVVTTLPVTLYTDGQPIAANLFNVNRQETTSFTTNETYYIKGAVGSSTSVSPSSVTATITNNTLSVTAGAGGYGVGFIKAVKPNTAYTLSFNTDITLENKTYAVINTITESLQFGTAVSLYNKTETITTSADTKYIYIVFRVVSNTCVYSNIMFNEGSTALPYQPYAPWVMKGNTETSGTPSPANPITINGVGNKTINLFNKNDSNILIGYEISSSGITENSEWFVSGYIPVEYGVTYHKNYNNGGRLLLYDSTKTELGTELFYSNNTYTVSNNNVKYIRINNTISALNTYMLNDISASEPFEPYGYKVTITSNQTALSPMYLTEQLMKIGDTVDSLSSNTLTKQTKFLQLTGDEDWQLQSINAYNIANFYIRLDFNINIYNGLCTHFERQTTIIANTQTEGFLLSANPYTIFIRIDANTASTVTELKNWLAGQVSNGTPVSVLFVLATATTETVTVPTIPTTGGTATIDVNTTVKPSEFDLSYHGWHEHQPKKKSANLANENDLDLQKWISSSGTVSDNPQGTIFKEKIAITTTNYTVKATANQSAAAGIGVAIYNSNDEFIRREYSTSSDKTLTFTTTTGDNYFKIIVATENTSTESLIHSLSIMANQGSTALPYVPYWQ